MAATLHKFKKNKKMKRSSSSSLLSMLFYVLAIACADVATSSNPDEVIDQISTEGSLILSGARMNNVFVRQCSCEEQRECTEEMKAQADACTKPCFDVFEKVTDRPAELRLCFDNKADIVESFINCFEKRVDACVPTMNGPRIPKTDISEIFHLAEVSVSRPPSATIQALIAPIKHYLDAAGEFALCVKDCFLGKNSAGFCYDKKGCQPMISDIKAQSSLRVCTKRVQWKRQAGEICDCSVNAGLTDLRQYCSIFKLMARRPIRHH